MEKTDFKRSRELMVLEQLKNRSIKDKKVLEAMNDIPREAFVPVAQRPYAYQDSPLPIGCGQTISQPYMVALMTELLKLTGEEKVLEIGTGSGYQTAILARLAKMVYTVERIPLLLEKARETLKELLFTNVNFRVDDGTLGWPEFSPYDRIIVTAASPQIPAPFLDQLRPEGVLLIPVGDSYVQTLKIITKKQDGFKEENSIDCVFVPLIGQHGWDR